MSGSTENTIEIVFEGSNIQPDRVRAHDLAEVLKATEALVLSSVARERPDLKDNIIIALDSVQLGSVNLSFASSLPEVTTPLFLEIGHAVSSQEYDYLTGAARESLKQFTAFNRKYGCETVFRTRSQDGIHVLASIKTDLDIPPTPRVYGETTIYGQLVSAGGKEPNVHLQALDGSEVICAGTQEIVKQLAERLYMWVGVSGTARWDVETLKISDFRITEILPYEDTPITEAIDALAAIAGPYFDEVDVNEFVHDIRGDTEE